MIKKTIISIDSQLLKKLKIYCIENDLTASDFINILLKEKLK